MFLGIPYAAPPTGEQRWRLPQPVEKWQGRRKADAYGAACPQAVEPNRNGYEKEMQTSSRITPFTWMKAVYI